MDKGVGDKTIYLSHFSSNGHETGAQPGVEKVMDAQEQILEEHGYEVKSIVGATDHPNPDSIGMMVYPEINSGAHGTWKEGQVDVDEEVVGSMVRKFMDTIGESPIILHNTTNAARHNPPFGVAAARIVDQRVIDGGAPAILWIHDGRGANARQFYEFMPKTPARMAAVSHVRAQQFIQKIYEVEQELGIELPEYDLQVIPNPISPEYFEPYSNALIPSSLHDLAPNFGTISIDGKPVLEQDYNKAEDLIFKSHDFKFIVPARIVGQKGVERAIDAARAYAQLTGERNTVIVTGPPDLRKPENKAYMHAIAEKINNLGSKDPNVVLLNGVDQRYMRFMYRIAGNGGTLIQLFENEGFGLPSIEAAVSEYSHNIISNDPAMLETTQGNALVIPKEIWGQPDQIALQLARYVSSAEFNMHPRNLAQIGHEHYSPAVVRERISNIIQG